MNEVTAVPLIWKYPGIDVWVTGNFNDFALQQLTGDAEKVAIVWIPSGTYCYRFLVDGSYICDPEKPQTQIDGVWYNEVIVAPVPKALAHIQELTADDLEQLDRELFSFHSRFNSRRSSFDSISSETTGPHLVPQTTVPKGLGLWERVRKIRCAYVVVAWFQRKKVRKQTVSQIKTRIDNHSKARSRLELQKEIPRGEAMR